VTGHDIPKFQLDEMPNPVASIYKTRDDRFIAFVLLQADRFWADFCERLGREDLVKDERFANAVVRFANRKECIAELRSEFASEDLAHWEKVFAGFDGVWDVMRRAREIHADPQAIVNGYLPRTTDASDNEFALAASPVQFDETPLQLTCAPGHGEHTDALLAELGYNDDEIIDFKIKSVVL
jgi:crotonobetainyl-CoA:carnitine CoA-transferase CaiB-like acyl-CoA transferase